MDKTVTYRLEGQCIFGNQQTKFIGTPSKESRIDNQCNRLWCNFIPVRFISMNLLLNPYSGTMILCRKIIQCISVIEVCFKEAFLKLYRSACGREKVSAIQTEIALYSSVFSVLFCMKRVTLWTSFLQAICK